MDRWEPYFDPSDRTSVESKWTNAIDALVHTLLLEIVLDARTGGTMNGCLKNAWRTWNIFGGAPVAATATEFAWPRTEHARTVSVRRTHVRVHRWCMSGAWRNSTTIVATASPNSPEASSNPVFSRVDLTYPLSPVQRFKKWGLYQVAQWCFLRKAKRTIKTVLWQGTDRSGSQLWAVQAVASVSRYCVFLLCGLDERGRCRRGGIDATDRWTKGNGGIMAGCQYWSMCYGSHDILETGWVGKGKGLR